MIKVDIVKAKEIAHEVRRAVRAVKMQPLDIEVTIPVMAEEAEAKRQVIRDEDALVQIALDEAVDEVELKSLLISNDLIEG